jgi:ubiquinone/menaquinone biosynthesis C-methylase UbiE
VVGDDTLSLIRLAEDVGKDWKQSPSYYEAAENDMDQQWRDLIWPFIRDCDFTCVVDLAAGHGRNSNKLKDVSKKIYLVDINEENLDYCRKRFALDARFLFLKTDGVSLAGIRNDEVTLVYCFDSMVHFDSDVVRAYLREFRRVLKPGGQGFCHHSNFTKNPGGDFRQTPHWRNFMSQELFAHYCHKEGLTVVNSKVIDWSEPALDCFTLFKKI